MFFVKKQLDGVADSLVRELASKVDVSENQMIGISNDINLEGSTGKADFNDEFILVYFVGSGDCPAGCINRTYHRVRVTPIKLPEGGYDFDVSYLR